MNEPQKDYLILIFLPINDQSLILLILLTLQVSVIYCGQNQNWPINQ